MELIENIFWQIILIAISGMIFSFVVWKFMRSKMDFGDFLSKYGEMLAYAGLLFIVLIIAVLQWTK